MKTILLSACAAALIASVTLPAAAGDYARPDDGPAGAIIGVGDNGYDRDDRRYGDPYGNDWPYQQPGYQNQGNNGGYDNSWGHDDDRGQRWGGGWGNSDYYDHNVLPPRRIVRMLKWNDFTYISQPVLSGRFYQVKAIAPNGRKVKLWVDAYSGRIVKVKRKG